VSGDHSTAVFVYRIAGLYTEIYGFEVRAHWTLNIEGLPKFRLTLQLLASRLMSVVGVFGSFYIASGCAEKVKS
jgi:hypothetical protein